MLDKILIVDDDRAFREVMSLDLQEMGLSVIQAGTGSDGIAEFRAQRPDLVLLDVRLPDLPGMAVLKQLRAIQGSTYTIVCSAFHDPGAIIECMKLGAYDYLCKPFHPEQLHLVVQHALRDCEASRRKDLLSPSVGPAVDSDFAIVGRSPAILGILKQIGAVAATRAPVLIQGESGTGKELVARAIHDHSEVEGPFIPVNCAAITESLSESELFGHERGAFTGALQRRDGRFELAHKGTLFLDEVGDLSPAIQAKLLRVLQDGEFERVGGTKRIKVDVRVIAATNRSLPALVLEGRFRHDLYHRLSAIVLTTPPLRDRREDIPPIMHHLIRRINGRIPSPTMGVSREVLAIFLQHDWPGNVREMENTLISAASIARGGVISEQHIPSWLHQPQEGESDLPLKSLREVEREHIARVLEATSHNRGRSCEILGISRPTLRKKMVEYGLSSTAGT